MIASGEPLKNSSSASAWLDSAILAGDAVRLFLAQAFRFFFELLFERFAERLAVVVGEAFDLVELPVAAFFDQRDFERLRAERAAFEFDLGGRLCRRSTETLETFAPSASSSPASGFFFAGLDRGLALFLAVLFDEAQRLEFGAVARVARRRRRFDRFGDLVFVARAAAAAGGERQRRQHQQRQRDENALVHRKFLSVRDRDRETRAA